MCDCGEKCNKSCSLAVPPQNTYVVLEEGEGKKNNVHLQRKNKNKKRKWHFPPHLCWYLTCCISFLSTSHMQAHKQSYTSCLTYTCRYQLHHTYTLDLHAHPLPRLPVAFILSFSRPSSSCLMHASNSSLFPLSLSNINLSISTAVRLPLRKINKKNQTLSSSIISSPSFFLPSFFTRICHAPVRSSFL